MKNVFIQNLLWMGWNLFLAFIPLFLSFFIFKKGSWNKSILKTSFSILTFLLFYLFLPNAPYVLTDIIHLIRQIKNYRYFNLTDTKIIFILIPQFLIFIFLGFSFYVIAFQKMLNFLVEIHFNKIIIWIVKILNPFLMAIGIFLGRYYRFNTWDIFGNYETIIRSTIDEFSNFYFVMFILLISLLIFAGFEILSIFYIAFSKNKIR